jgi:hypothetical protein
MSAVSIFWTYTFAGFLFITVIGLFNVISAIFVQSVMASADNLLNQRKVTRLEDEEIWANNIVVLLRALNSGLTDDCEQGLHLEDSFCFTPKQVDKLLVTQVPRSVLDRVIENNKSAVQALHNLDIDQRDHKHLPDILDPDNSGSISMPELVDGLKRLRGDARRSDIISVDLMIRSLQERMEDVIGHLTDKSQTTPSVDSKPPK